MNRNLFSALALCLTAASAFAQNPTHTAAGIGGLDQVAGGYSIPQGVCWYNGDFDNRNGFTSERNTAVFDSWTFDDVNWPGGVVEGFLGHYLINPGTTVIACDIVVYSGLSEGNFGRQMAAVSDVIDFTFVPVGIWGRVYLLEANLGSSSFHLPEGTYHVGIRCVGSGSGQAFVVVTSGANAIGTPPGNNGRTFLQSDYFGFPLPTDWQNLVGTGIWDVSYGLICGGGGGYSLAISGACPGTVRLEWSGADPDRQQGILVASSTGNITLPGGQCEGTQLGLGRQNLRLHRIISTGEGAGAVSAGTQACGWYVQLIQTHSCATSNVAQVP